MMERRFWKALVIIALVFMVVDGIYKNVNNITYLEREKCIVYASLPRPMFLLFEYFIELPLLVIVGIHLAALLEKHFSKYKRLYPHNPPSAFIYGSILPVCACTIIPMIKTMRGRLGVGTVIAFIVAAPLLSPYIIFLSFTVIGWEYGVLRILSAFVLAMVCAYVMKRTSIKGLPAYDKLGTSCDHASCPIDVGDTWGHSQRIFESVLPFLIIAGVMGFSFEYFIPQTLLVENSVSDSDLGLILATTLGIPLFFCSGAEILILRPMMHYAMVPMGTAIAFSLTSTSICITSFVMLTHFIGKREALTLAGTILLTSILIGYIINITIG